MDDQDLETRLRAYRPANPPDALRARVVGGVEARRLRAEGASTSLAEGRSTLAWLPAVAALLIATALYWIAASDRARLVAQFPVVSDEETIVVNMETQP